MRISTNAMNGEKRVAFQNNQLGCALGLIIPSMKNQPLVSYEYATLTMRLTAVSTIIAVFNPFFFQLATAGRQKGRHTVANVSADKNHVGAFHSSACTGNHACDSVKVVTACQKVAIGPFRGCLRR